MLDASTRFGVRVSETSGMLDYHLLDVSANERVDVVLPRLEDLWAPFAWHPMTARVVMSCGEVGGGIETEWATVEVNLETRELEWMKRFGPRSRIEDLAWCPDGTTLAVLTSQWRYAPGALESLLRYSGHPRRLVACSVHVRTAQSWNSWDLGEPTTDNGHAWLEWNTAMNKPK